MFADFLLLLLLPALLLVLTGIIYQAIGAARDARLCPPPGRRVRVGKYSLHIHCAGESGPAVILEAGIAASSLSWSHVQPEVARFTRVCRYDRAGLGWSDRAPQRQTAAQMADALHALLEAAGVAPPFVLAAHSFGGLAVRAYANKYPQEVVGIVLVDALHPDEWRTPTREQRRMIRGGAFLARIGALLAAVGFVRLCLALLARGSRRVPRMAARSFGASVASVTGRIVGEVRKLPERVWPMVRAHWSQPKSFLGMADHLAMLPRSSAEVAAMGNLGDIPLIVLSAGNSGPSKEKEQADLARLSSNSKQVRGAQSGHWIHLDEPELVVAAIRELVEAHRKKSGAT